MNDPSPQDIPDFASTKGMIVLDGVGGIMGDGRMCDRLSDEGFQGPGGIRGKRRIITATRSLDSSDSNTTHLTITITTIITGCLVCVRTLLSHIVASFAIASDCSHRSCATTTPSRDETLRAEELARRFSEELVWADTAACARFVAGIRASLPGATSLSGSELALGRARWWRLLGPQATWVEVNSSAAKEAAQRKLRRAAATNVYGLGPDYIGLGNDPEVVAGIAAAVAAARKQPQPPPPLDTNTSRRLLRSGKTLGVAVRIPPSSTSSSSVRSPLPVGRPSGAGPRRPNWAPCAQCRQARKGCVRPEGESEEKGFERFLARGWKCDARCLRE
ncbi:hypothetical protein QBC44DRAFT_313192 [Cladorrhinum sp. PSN332]|nr:hypothetical protein QBC44DRAFT_313192 [Cladorrhinum sp. PSN332]